MKSKFRQKGKKKSQNRTNNNNNNLKQRTSRSRSINEFKKYLLIGVVSASVLIGEYIFLYHNTKKVREQRIREGTAATTVSLNDKNLNDMKKKQVFELGCKLMDYMFSFPPKDYASVAEYTREVNRYLSLIKQKFGIDYGQISLPTDFPILNKKLYVISANGSEPNVVLIRSDPRFLVMHEFFGENVDLFMEFLDYYIKPDSVDYSKTDTILSADMIIKKKKGMCYEESVVFASYLESIGIPSQILLFNPPDSKGSIGHAAVRVVSGKYKGRIFDPALKVVAPGFESYIVFLSSRMKQWYSNGQYRVIVDRLFTEGELPPPVKSILERNNDTRENEETLRSFWTAIENKVKQERKTMPATEENILLLLEKYGRVGFTWNGRS
ncbi:transglutaminase domain-containing protein [Candidatus Micrarchaeota archaeon]|nr:transglutaminase domain-containing protein [Candidatus Micrarchaeota archaeon]